MSAPGWLPDEETALCGARRGTPRRRRPLVRRSRTARRARRPARIGAGPGETLPQHSPAAVQLQVDRTLEVEDHDIVTHDVPRQSSCRSCIVTPRVELTGPRSRAARGASLGYRREDESLYLMSPMEIVLGYLGHRDPTAAHRQRRRTSEVLEDIVPGPCCARRVAWRSPGDGTPRWCSRWRRMWRAATACPSRCRSRGCFPACPRRRRAAGRKLVVRHLGLRDWHRVSFTTNSMSSGRSRAPHLSSTASCGRRRRRRHPAGRSRARWIGNRRRGRRRGARRRRPSRRPVGEPRPSIAATAAMASVRRRSAPWPRRRSASDTYGVDGRAADTWLRPAARDDAPGARTRSSSKQPLSSRRACGWSPRRRTLVSAPQSSDPRRARDVDFEPAASPGFVHASPVTAACSGPGDRPAVCARLRPDLLPDEVLARTSKARSRGATWYPTRGVRAAWTRRRVDPTWSTPTSCGDLDQRATPRPTAALLQPAWLAATTGRRCRTGRPRSRWLGMRSTPEAY